jgi:hypothetical protein
MLLDVMLDRTGNHGYQTRDLNPAHESCMFDREDDRYDSNQQSDEKTFVA